ncbi:MAG: LAGLIDADG family homing endonuclease [Actinomycetota bacterium]|nr:LAGLIDADG family homing endonuclease [Actinomycetota bacterium]
MPGADNQQERLDSYIAGYVDGEGSFSVSVQRNATCRVGFQLVPEFHVSQNGDRAQVLRLILDRLGCGSIRPNSKRDRTLVLVVRKREDLLERVIPFFERNPMLSSKQADFEKFAEIVRELALGHHRTHAGFGRLLEIAVSMNGGGRYRKVRWVELVSCPESSETARQTRPVTARKIQSELHGDMQSQAEMTWPPSAFARE